MSVIELSSRAIDPNVKQRRASDPECSVWVGASAGTGKTKVLTDRVLRLMLGGDPAVANPVPDLHQGGGGGNVDPHQQHAGPLGDPPGTGWKTTSPT